MMAAFQQVPTVGSGTTWVAIAGLAISAVLAAIRLLEFIRERRARSELHLALTQNAFFRLTDSGETAFVSAVMFATRRAAFVNDVGATLSRKDGSKRFNLQLRSLGQPADRGTPVHDHFFFSASPLDLVPIDQPIRRVYMFVIGDYAPRLADSIQVFTGKLIPLKATVEHLNSMADGNEKVAGTLSLKNEVLEHRQRFVQGVMDHLQLEGGRYRIDVVCKYRDAHAKHDDGWRQSSSAIEFEIDAQVRDGLRVDLERFADGMIAHVMFGVETKWVWPEVAPRQVSVLGPTKG